jgi:tRNA-splicing ligase RtcB
MERFKIFADEKTIDPEALKQFHSAMDNSFVIRGALMPDAHAGYSLPIGAVVATNGVILPSWVGYDIGCGVAAARLDIGKEALEQLETRKDIHGRIESNIPTGMGELHKRPLPYAPRSPVETDFMKRLTGDAFINKSLGTLGGGNHFIELGYDEESKLWVVIHSGSRGLGHKTATNYMKLASKSDKPLEGHFGFDVESKDGKNYISDMNFCLEFAYENRRTMLSAVVKSLKEALNAPVNETYFVNRNHNHAEYKDGMWIHRKGATHAEEAMDGVIPGNMRDGSFIVRGRGNPESLWSSAHGAGRAMSRGQARREITMDAFKHSMEGVVGNVNERTKDESPFAYKNIFKVMEQQESLVEVLHHIRPMINVKGEDSARRR